MPSNIRLFPDPILRKKTAAIDRFDHSLKKLVDRLAKTMESQRHGIGIAAPQIGILKQVAIVDVSARVGGARRLVLVNPRVVRCSEKVLSREGCMSIPDYSGQVTRYDSIDLAWRDESGRFLQQKFTGIEAICIQHEIDHLHGKLFLDHVQSMKRDMIPRSRKYPKS